MGRQTMHTLSDEILSHLVNLTTPHEQEARLSLPGGITLARCINYGNVERITPAGKERLIMTRDVLAEWRNRQYGMSPHDAARAVLDGAWPQPTEHTCITKEHDGFCYDN